MSLDWFEIDHKSVETDEEYLLYDSEQNSYALGIVWDIENEQIDWHIFCAPRPFNPTHALKITKPEI